MSEIRRATKKDAETILNILVTCANWLAENDMNHWLGAYSIEGVSKRIETMEVYLATNELKEPVGTIALTNHSPDYYVGVDTYWLDSTSPAIYIKGLAVLPKHQGKGIAKTLLQFAEEKTKEKRIKFIRLDAVANYNELTQFYLKRGFKLVGKTMLGGQASNLFEKQIT